jgi:hypothetical protein
MSDPTNEPGNKNQNGAYDGNPDELHDLFAGGEAGTEEDDPLAALRNDPNYAALIRDLELIAVEARRLFEPAQETPSDTVWEKIQQGLGTKPTDA